MSHFRVRITDERLAEIDGTPLVPAPGESVHDAVLDRLQRHAQERAAAVRATVNDGPDTGHFLLEISPDGSSRLLDASDPEPAGTPEPPQTPGSPRSPEPSEPSEAPHSPASRQPSQPLTPAKPTKPDLRPLRPAVPASGPAVPASGPPAVPPPGSAVSASDPAAPATVPASRPAPLPSARGAVATRARTTAASHAAAGPRVPDPAPQPALASPVPVPDPAPQPALAPVAPENPAVAPAPLAAAPAAGLTGDVADRIGRINADAAAGRLDEAYADATTLRESLAETVGADHPHAVEARALEAYLAHLCGDHREATVLALGVARIRCVNGDERAASDVARATAAWQHVEDGRAAAVYGTELLHMWDTLRDRGALTADQEELAEWTREQLEALLAHV